MKRECSVHGRALSGPGSTRPLAMHYESSIVSTLANRVLTSAIVIIDTDEAMGRRLDALAAYAALVALAEIRNAEVAPSGSWPCSDPQRRRAT